MKETRINAQDRVHPRLAVNMELKHGLALIVGLFPDMSITIQTVHQHACVIKDNFLRMVSHYCTCTSLVTDNVVSVRDVLFEIVQPLPRKPPEITRLRSKKT